MGCSYRFGLQLLLFYYSSTKLTKYKQDVKDRLEEDIKTAGERNWKQVFASSILAVAVAMTYIHLIGNDENISFRHLSPETVSFFDWKLQRSQLSSQLQCMYLAHFATANGDTWASEVGMLAKTSPRLITSLFLRKVPPGTNGGMSVLGTLASAAGGAFISIIYWALSPFYYPSNGVQDPQWITVVFGFLCGLIGSIIDSFLGATLQVTYYNTETKKIVKELPSSSESHQYSAVKRICGMDILSNEAVNVLSIALTMLLSLLLAPALFQRLQ